MFGGDGEAGWEGAAPRLPWVLDWMHLESRESTPFIPHNSRATFTGAPYTVSPVSSTAAIGSWSSKLPSELILDSKDCESHRDA